MIRMPRRSSGLEADAAEAERGGRQRQHGGVQAGAGGVGPIDGVVEVGAAAEDEVRQVIAGDVTDEVVGRDLGDVDDRLRREERVQQGVPVGG